ncbi:hypothetical protein Vretifemale_14410, partial [Volvox reticuliferus]
PEQPVSVWPPGLGPGATASRPSVDRPPYPPPLRGVHLPAGAHLGQPAPPLPHSHSHSDMAPQHHHYHNHHHYPHSQAPWHAGGPVDPQDLEQLRHQQPLIHDPDRNHTRSMSAPRVTNQWLRPPPAHHIQQQVEAQHNAVGSAPLDAPNAVQGGLGDTRSRLRRWQQRLRGTVRTLANTY